MNENTSISSATSSTSGPNSARRWSLAARLTAWYTGSAFVLILATTAFLYWAVVTILENEDDQYLLDKSRVLLVMMREQSDDVRELRAEIERESEPRPNGQLYLRLFDAAGKMVAESSGMGDRLPAERFSPVTNAAESGVSGEFQSPSGHSYRTLMLKASDGRVAQVAMDRTVEEDLLARYRWYVGFILTGALLVCAIAGYGFARRGLRPLRDVIRAARRVRSSTLHERIDSTALPAELAELADTFNEMLDRLEDSFGRLERFSADIAHELRTPVNNLRGEAEITLGQSRTLEQYREVLESGLEEYGRLSGLIDNLLFLARAESPRALINREPIDLAKELTTVRDFYEPTAAEAGVELQVRADTGINADLDRTLFQQAVGNLVANALAHTPSGGTVTLSARRSAGEVTVEVTDTGRGIAPEHLPHVFDRFYRADSSRSENAGSVGLGLALVKSIAVLHGGSCTIMSEVGNGATVRVVFPVKIPRQT